MTKEVKSIIILCIVSCFSSALLTVLVAYPRGSGTDGAFYALSGANLFLGNGFTYSDVPNTFTWPLFSVLIGILNLLLDDLQISGHVVLVLSFSLSIIPFYFAVKNFFGERTARIAVYLYFLNGFLLRLSGRFLAESLLIFCLLCALYYVSAIIKSDRESSAITIRDPILAGFFLGLAYLTKPEAFQYFIIGWLFLSIMLIRKHKKHLVQSSAMFAVFTLTVLPQIFFIHEVTGKWELSTYNRFLFRGYVEPLVSLNPGEAAKDRSVEHNYNAYIVRGPYTKEQRDDDLAGLRQHSLQYTKSLLTIIGPFHIFILLCSFFLYDPALKSARNLLILFMIPVITLFFWYNPVDRHFIVFIPFFIILSAAVLDQIYIRYNRQGRYIVWITCALLFLQSYTPIANHAPSNAVIGNHRKMGEWMRDHLPEARGKLIADRKPYIAFLAQARYYRYNQTPDIGTLKTILKENKIDYLIVDDFYTKTKNPGVAELLDGRDRPNFQFIHAVEDSIWGKAILYLVK